MTTRAATNNGLAQRAYATMRDRILRGDYEIGQVISRRRIAADLGVSFLPASEALLRLECEGLLESRPRAGTRIRIPTREDVEGHFVVREALEAQAAMLFSQVATEQERDELIRLAARLDTRTVRTANDPIGQLTAHEKFHQKIAEYTRCEALNEALRRSSALGAAWLGAIKSALPLVSQVRHDALAKALSGNKPAIAADAMRTHMSADRDSIIQALEPFFESKTRKLVETYSRTLTRKIDPEMPEFEIAAIPPSTRAAHFPVAIPR